MRKISEGSEWSPGIEVEDAFFLHDNLPRVEDIWEYPSKKAIVMML